MKRHIVQTLKCLWDWTKSRRRILAALAIAVCLLPASARAVGLGEGALARWRSGRLARITRRLRPGATGRDRCARSRPLWPAIAGVVRRIAVAQLLRRGTRPRDATEAPAGARAAPSLTRCNAVCGLRIAADGRRSRARDATVNNPWFVPPQWPRPATIRRIRALWGIRGTGSGAGRNVTGNNATGA